MVVTFRPATFETEIWQERTALPSTCTVQAPHRPDPQPNLVPVSFNCSRTTQSKGVSGSASTLAGLPFIVNAVAAMNPLPRELFIVIGLRLICAFGGRRPHSCGDGGWAQLKFRCGTVLSQVWAK